MELFDNDKALAEKIQSSNAQTPVSTKLETDGRIIARITDGIYRHPGSALRELISNAYDADATKVVIKTDAPRFSRISIEDDGHGMSPETLAYMLKHIGGSSKRNIKGQQLGVTSKNSLRSPEGRKLIGKIGIGLFSVAQLTLSFQIITKRAGDDFRTVAVINLKQFSDEPESSEVEIEDAVFEAGLVSIWKEPALDHKSQGTTIVLTNIRTHTKETLQSRKFWLDYEDSISNPNSQDVVSPPKFHIGKVQAQNKSELETNLLADKSVPWDNEDLPDVAFSKLVNVVWQEASSGNQNPRLESIFDYYLQMIWSLSLATPLPYIDGNLFDMDMSDWMHPFLISNEPKGVAKSIDILPDTTFRNYFKFQEEEELKKFDVFFDNLQLSHPIKYKGLPTGKHRLNKPLIFFGKVEQEFANIQKEYSTGTLQFDAYLFWNPIIAPAEHRGALIRVNGASGTLFDPTFLNYQVSEQVRLRQITCEIFVHQGFDSALNIDRESFNFAHPHAVYIARWLHNALRQLATAQKRLASEVRIEARDEEEEQFSKDIKNLAISIWQREVKDDYSLPPSVEIVSDDHSLFDENVDILIRRPSSRSGGKKRALTANEKITNEKAKAISQIMAAFRLFDQLTTQEQQRLLNAIYDVLDTSK